MANTAKVPTPTLDELSAHIKERNAIVHFLEWLESERGIRLSQYHEHADTCMDERGYHHTCGLSNDRLYPVAKRFESLAHQFLELDEAKIEEERRALLDSLGEVTCRLKLNQSVAPSGHESTSRNRSRMALLYTAAATRLRYGPSGRGTSGANAARSISFRHTTECSTVPYTCGHRGSAGDGLQSVQPQDEKNYEGAGMSRMIDLCDVQCDECSQWTPGLSGSIAKERARLKKQLWTIRWCDNKKQDVCPQCAGYDAHYWAKHNRTY